jgi:DNA gyrase subunit B
VVGNFLISLGVDFKAFDAQVKARVPNPTFPVDKLRVQRIYFLADADVDGYHINSLFLAIIWKLLPDLLYQGRVYVVDAPLYNVMHKKKHYGGATKQELLQNAPSTVKPSDVTRAKGWGEVSPEIMEAIAFDPSIRRVIRIQPFAKQESLAWYNRVLGDDASARRQLLGLSS